MGFVLAGAIEFIVWDIGILVTLDLGAANGFWIALVRFISWMSVPPGWSGIHLVILLKPSMCGTRLRWRIYWLCQKIYQYRDETGIFVKTRSDLKYLLDSLYYLAWSQAPYIHVILSYIVSITWYITQPLVRMLLWIINLSVSMISFAQVWTVQWSDTIPCQNVQFQVRIHLTWFCFNTPLNWTIPW